MRDIDVDDIGIVLFVVTIVFHVILICLSLKAYFEFDLLPPPFR